MRPATPRELEVLAAVVTTGSEKAAACRLGLAQGTVKQHLARVRARVGAANTTQAVWRLRHEIEVVGCLEAPDQRRVAADRREGEGIRAAGAVPARGPDPGAFPR